MNAETKKTRTLQQLAREALDVQDACNLCGVAQGFARAMLELGEYCPSGTDERNQHPIAQIWIDKMSSLARTQNEPFSVLFKAFDAVEKLAAGDAEAAA